MRELDKPGIVSNFFEQCHDADILVLQYMKSNVTCKYLLNYLMNELCSRL